MGLLPVGCRAEDKQCGDACGTEGHSRVGSSPVLLVVVVVEWAELGGRVGGAWREVTLRLIVRRIVDAATQSVLFR
ncbi:hypothetical protein CRUP_003027 [Coryphaenoides rupestris]|nr:hypothetical protein CRUP_003027 [Coryphaenoides rupestris]